MIRNVQNHVSILITSNCHHLLMPGIAVMSRKLSYRGLLSYNTFFNYFSLFAFLTVPRPVCSSAPQKWCMPYLVLICTLVLIMEKHLSIGVPFTRRREQCPEDTDPSTLFFFCFFLLYHVILAQPGNTSQIL